MEEFVHGLLLPLLEHVLKQAEGDLGDEELVMVPVVALHLGPLPADLLHAVVIRSPQLIEFRVEIVSLVL